MILIVIVIAGVSGGGVYFWQNNKTKLEKQVLQNQIAELQKKIQTTNNMPDNGLQTNLKTYKIDFWGVSFQYPDNYLVETSESVEGAAIYKILSKETKKWEDEEIAKCEQAPGDSSCGIYDALYVDGLVIVLADMNLKKLSLNSWISNMGGAQVLSRKNFTINSLEAIEVLQEGLDGKSVFISDKDGKIYKLKKPSKDDPIIDQIINSFEII